MPQLWAVTGSPSTIDGKPDPSAASFPAICGAECAHTQRLGPNPRLQQRRGRQVKLARFWRGTSVFRRRKALRLAGEVLRVALGVGLPLRRQLVLREAGIDRTCLDAGVAVDALVGVDV